MFWLNLYIIINILINYNEFTSNFQNRAHICETVKTRGHKPMVYSILYIILTNFLVQRPQYTLQGYQTLYFDYILMQIYT